MSLLIATESGLSSVDIATGNLIKAYKQCDNIRNGVVLVEKSARPASFLCLQKDRPLIHHYQPKKEAVFKRIVLPGKMSALSLSPNGQWLAAGSQEGALYVWNLYSGALKTLSSDAHFQAITTLSWSRDSSVLVTGGEDARVLIWRLIDLVASGSPTHVLTPHTLPLTACVLSFGGFREARLYTASLDATVSVFDVYSGLLLYTLACDSKISSLAMDPAERYLYLGCTDGVHSVPLYYEPPSSKLISVGSADGTVVSTRTVGERVLKPEGNTSVTALCVSADAAHLFVGTEDGGVYKWETGSGQLVKKYRSTKGAVCGLVSTAVFEDTVLGEIPVLQRNIETESLGFIPPEVSAQPKPIEPAAEMDEIDAFAPTTVVVQKDEKEPDSELEELRARHEQLQKMYDALWARHTQ